MTQPTYTHERNYGCRVTEAIYRGLRTVTLENEIIRVTVLADKGSDIIEFLHKPTDTDFMWRSPQGVQNPATFVPTAPMAHSSTTMRVVGRSACRPAVARPSTAAPASGRTVRSA